MANIITDEVDHNQYPLKNLPAPVDDNDVATKSYVDDHSEGGGGSETFQQTLTNGSVLTQDNAIENGTNNLHIDVNGHTYLDINGSRKNSSFGMTDSSGNFYGLEAHTGTIYMGADGGNETHTAIDDIAQTIISQSGNSTLTTAADGTLKFYYEDPWFIVDGQNRRFQIGDYTSDWYGTYIDINDDADSKSISYKAFIHQFFGKINNQGLQNFENNAAAITGGLVAGDLYYTNVSGDGILKVVI